MSTPLSTTSSSSSPWGYGSNDSFDSLFFITICRYTGTYKKIKQDIYCNGYDDLVKKCKIIFKLKKIIGMYYKGKEIKNSSIYREIFKNYNKINERIIIIVH